VVFGHHFAAIAGAGPLIGPVLAAQYGWGPSFFWILLGSIFAGAVHDMIILFGSMRHKGQSISVIAKNEVSPITGVITGIVILFIIMITLAGVGTVVVNALFHNPWGVFSIAMTIPIAMLVGFYIYHLKPGTVAVGSILGIVLVCASVFLGPYLANSPYAAWFSFERKTLAVILPVYGFFAAVLPMWLLLTPRGYLSTYMKIGVILMLAIGLFFARPLIKMPFATEFMQGGGPIFAGPCWPVVFITIACGAISGFHALIGSGTTPKLVEKESHIPIIGFGAMLLEGFVAIMALLAVVTLEPADYFAMNASVEAFARLNMNVVNLPALSNLIGLDVAHRPGGAISLAVGMASIFSGFSVWLQDTMKYWFQFMIMFEALFILTLIDAGTRVARYMLQGVFGNIYPKVKNSSWLPGVMFTSAAVSLIWGYLLYTGDISSLWPLFGATNQALSALALALGTTIILKINRKKIYALITVIPCLFIFTTAIAACVLNTKMFFLKGQIINTWISAVLIVMILMVIADNIRVWFALLKSKELRGLCLPTN
jgi:carbon starvation protein